MGALEEVTVVKLYIREVQKHIKAKHYVAAKHYAENVTRILTNLTDDRTGSTDTHEQNLRVTPGDNQGGTTN